MAELGTTSAPRALVPGQPGQVTAAAAAWRARGAAAEQASASLQKLGVPEGWTGRAADRYETRLASVARRWATVADALTAAAAALDTYAGELTWAQGQAAVAITTWQRGQAKTAEALVPSPGASLYGVDTTSAVDPGATLRLRAREILDDARERVQLAGDAAAAALRAAGAEPELDQDVWLALGTSLTSGQVLTSLAGLDADDIKALVRIRPDIGALLAESDPTDVASWWDGLSTAQQGALIGALPAVVGNLGGVAFAARNEANRVFVDQQLKAARAEVERLDSPRNRGIHSREEALADLRDREHAQAQLDALENIDKALQVSGDDPERFLVSLTSDNPPLAAVSIGDLGQAQNVTYTVPGMGTTTSDMSGWARAASHLQVEQTFADPTRTQAVVAWIGYETPPFPGEGGLQVLGTEYARTGADKLDDALAGFTAARPDAALNIVAHSYGTPTAAIALAEGTSHADTFVSIGSAGLPPDIDHATDLHAGEVFAGQARDVWAIDPAGGDQWAWTGRAFGDHPVNPVLPDFGAQTFGTDTGVGGTPVTDHSATANGGGYLDLGTESLRNIAYVTTGHAGLASPHVPPSLTPMQQGLIDGMGRG